MSDVRRGLVNAGIRWMLLATVSFASMHAALKYIAPHYPLMQVTAIRGLASLPLILAWLALSGQARSVVAVRVPLQLTRGAISIGIVYFTAMGLAEVPLADAYTISFLGPILVAALSMPLLGERVNVRRWVAVVVGFLGIAVALRPSGGGMVSTGGLAMLASATLFAMSALLARVLVRTDSTLAMITWMTASVAIGASLMALPNWVEIRVEHLWLLPLIGVAGMAGQFAFTEAVRRSPVSVIAPYDYCLLIWGAALDWLIWGSYPGLATAFGAALIVASGIYLYRSEAAAARD